MNIRVCAASLGLLMLWGIAFAGVQAPNKRLDQIWNAIDNRVQSQTDTWFTDGDFPKSIELLVFEAEMMPHDYDVVTNLGWMQENVEEWDAALLTYKRYLKNNPQDKDRALPEADFLFRRHQYAAIPALLEPVIGLKPHLDNFHILAHSYERLKRYQDAKRIWEASIAADPSDAAAKANLTKVEKRLAAAKSG